MNNLKSLPLPWYPHGIVHFAQLLQTNFFAWLRFFNVNVAFFPFLLCGYFGSCWENNTNENSQLIGGDHKSCALENILLALFGDGFSFCVACAFCVGSASKLCAGSANEAFRQVGKSVSRQVGRDGESKSRRQSLSCIPKSQLLFARSERPSN